MYPFTHLEVSFKFMNYVNHPKITAHHSKIKKTINNILFKLN